MLQLLRAMQFLHELMAVGSDSLSEPSSDSVADCFMDTCITSPAAMLCLVMNTCNAPRPRADVRSGPYSANLAFSFYSFTYVLLVVSASFLNCCNASLRLCGIASWPTKVLRRQQHVGIPLPYAWPLTFTVRKLLLNMSFSLVLMI